MAEAAISFLLQNLKEMVYHHITLNSKATHELDQLEKQMVYMKEYLHIEVERKSTREFRNWESKILEAVYEAEDLIDSYVIQEKAQTKRRRLNQGRGDLVIQMKQLREDLQSTFKMAKSQLAELPTSDESTARTKRFRQVNPLVEKTVVGMKDAINGLISDLLTSSSEVESICIVGMAGLGKSTIASAVYRHPSINHHFPTRIWVNVSEDYKARDIYLTIVKKFTDRDMSEKEDSDLAMLAQKRLSDVKFLLVMDDVWTAEAWNVIKQALPIIQGSGKVLVTSRNDYVATHVNPHRQVDRLRFLNPIESWELLQLEVYGKEGKWPEDLEKIGKQISRKCDGLPLAIVVIGGILVSKLSQEETRKDEWKKVLESAEIELLKVKEDDMVTSVKSIVGLSYYKMPYYLRHCFLYLGVFPRDFEIPTWKLIRLWIAEGFIEDEGDPNKSLEDIAEEYLKELIRRNLVMIGKKNPRGNIKTCRVHDVIREFCKNEALNLLKVISKSLTTGAFHPDISEIRKFRRICVHSDVLDLLQRKLDAPHVRSFICLSKHVVGAETNTLPSVVEAFNLLRVFEGSSIQFPKYDPKITQLIHLRYITLATGEDFNALPPTFAQLLNLQTIVISTSKRTFEIRANIFEMTQLRHLKTKAAIVIKLEKKYWGNKNSGVNEKIQTLGNLSTQSCTMETLRRASNLQTLGISGDIDSLCNVRGLEKLRYLKRLKITNFAPPEMPIPRLLDAQYLPTKLVQLTLSATNLDWHYMRTLGRLELTVLKLKDNAFNGDDWEVVQGEFLSLEHLVIERSNLVSWTMKEGCLENLKYLHLYTCEKLLAVPHALAKSKSLKTLEMGNVSTNAVLSGKVIEEAKSGHVDAFNLILAPGTYVPT